MTISNNKSIVTFISLPLCIICLLLRKQDVIYYGLLIYLIQYITITVIIFKEKMNYLLFLSPSYLCISYLSLNFILGHYTVSRGIGFDLKYFHAFQNYESINFITIFFLLCNLCVFLSMNFKSSDIIIANKFEIKNSFKHINGLIILGLIFALGFLTIDFSFLGGAGNFNYSIRLGFGIILVFILNKKNVSKYFYYSTLLLLFLINHYDSKREILYIIILIVFFELIEKQKTIKFGFKELLYFSFVCLLSIFIILTSSIMRGYGNYNVDNPVEASHHIINYIKRDDAKNVLVENFELLTEYGNASNAIDYVYKREVGLLYGSTFLKFIFLPIPKKIFPKKPASMINIYTTKFAPDFSARGGSYPISVYSEAFWNFHLLALCFLYFIFKYFNRLYMKLIFYVKQKILNIKSFFLLYMYITIIQFIRGSGFELWLLYAIVSLPFSFLIIISYKKIKIIN